MTALHELAVERRIAAPPAALWRAYTDHLGEWFCPRPWRAEVVAMELRPGGRSAITMYGPEGEVMPNEGVYLEVVPERRIVSTDAFTAGWVPAGPFLVACYQFEPDGTHTLFRATARHWNAAAAAQHEAMGFHQGWGTVCEQLEDVALRLAAEHA